MLIVGYLEVGNFFEWAAEWVLRRVRDARTVFCSASVVGVGLLSCVFVNDHDLPRRHPVLLAALGPFARAARIPT